MLRRVASFLIVVWALGFAWTAIMLPQPAGDERTDGVIVLTGGEGRIPRGLDVLRAGDARLMLVSGVDPEVRPREFAASYDVERKYMRCCITLGFEAVDTRSNGREAARWIAANDLKSVRLITTDWHMRRAAFELRQALPDDIVLVYDAVPGHPSLNMLFKEYNKYLLRRAAAVIGI